MAKEVFQKGTNMWVTWQDIYKFCQEYWIPEDKEEYWEQLIKSADSFIDTHKDNDFAKQFILWFVNEYLNNKFKEMKDNGKK